MVNPTPRNRRVGAGLKNGSFTCYLNAVLQCLTHTVPLVEMLRQTNHLANCRIVNDGFCALCILIRQIDFSIRCSGSVIEPTTFWRNLTNIAPNFQPRQPEDAHEFLQCLLYAVHAFWLISHTDQTVLSLDKDSLITQIFRSRLRSQLRCCDCGYFWATFEPFLDLSLEIDEAADLVDALKLFTKVEKIDPEIKFDCEGCKAKVTVEKQLILDQAPQVIAFHLKRLKYDSNGMVHIEHFVNYPLELNLQPFLSSSEYEVNYELYAIIVHDRRVPSGHYITLIRTDPNTWHKMDDYLVTACEENYVFNQNAYILFYIKKGSSPWFSSLMDNQPEFINLASDSEEDCSEVAESDQVEVLEVKEGKNVVSTENYNAPIIASLESSSSSSHRNYDKMDCDPWKMFLRNARQFFNYAPGNFADNKELADKFTRTLAMSDRFKILTAQLEKPPMLSFRLSGTPLQTSIQPLKKPRKAIPRANKPQDPRKKEPKKDADKDME